jgi:hypothetical protein
LKQANTGDILLFRANYKGGKLIRFLTRGEIDHVAMILKFSSDIDDDDNEVYLFDATQDNGVALTKWSTIRNHIGKSNSMYAECIYRKVNFNRNGLGMVNLEKLLDESLGRNYALSINKIYQQNTLLLTS